MPIKPGSPSVRVPGYDVQVLDDTGQPVPAGQEGDRDQVAAAPGTLPTLWRDDERYVSGYLSVYDGYYLTGDGGLIDEDGYVYVMGRTDDVLNVAGHRLSTGSIEAALAGHPDVAECGSSAWPTTSKGQIPRGLVVLKAGVDADAEGARITRELVQRVRDEVGAVASLRQVDIVGGLPKTRSARSCARRCARWPTARRQRSRARSRTRACSTGLPACWRTPSTGRRAPALPAPPHFPTQFVGPSPRKRLHPAYPTTWVGKWEGAKGRRAAGSPVLDVLSGFATIAIVIAVGAFVAHIGLVDASAQVLLSRIAFFRLPCAAPHDDRGDRCVARPLRQPGRDRRWGRRPSPSRMPWSASRVASPTRGAGHRVIGQFLRQLRQPGIPVAAYALGSASFVAPLLLLQLLVLPTRGALPSWTPIASGRRPRARDLLVRPLHQSADHRHPARAGSGGDRLVPPTPGCYGRSS